ncbi:MAG: dihydroorotase, partial [Flavobacteriales bacterium]|nr:dihydroorotase [Flavobacteriales bacterium]
MKTLLKSVRIVDPSSKLDGKTRDILIENGKIAEIGSRSNAPEKSKVVQIKGMCASPGWFDTFASIPDPGYEYKEDLASGLEAAAAGGFSGMLISPATEPPIDRKSAVEYARRRADGFTTQLEVCGALSAGLHGKQLAELFDLRASGAKAFGDGKSPLDRTELMYRGLEYVRNFDGVVFAFPHDPGLN